MQLLRCVEMGVEGGRDTAHQKARLVGNRKLRAVEFDDTMGDQFSQARCGFQRGLRGRSVPGANGIEVDAEIAHDALDDVRAQPVIGRQRIAFTVAGLPAAIDCE